MEFLIVEFLVKQKKRSHLSLNGCVTLLSMDTGKSIHVEVLNKSCRSCEIHEPHENVQEELKWHCGRQSMQGSVKPVFKGQHHHCVCVK